jgi:hypothetical protein
MASVAEAPAMQEEASAIEAPSMREEAVPMDEARQSTHDEKRSEEKDSTRQGTGEDTICGETKVWDTSKLKKGKSEARRERKKMRRHTFHLVKSWKKPSLKSGGSATRMLTKKGDTNPNGVKGFYS